MSTRSYGGWLKQSAGVTICLGPFVDVTDDVTAESGLDANMDSATGVLISKNGGSLAVRASGITATAYDDDGYYQVNLTASDTDTLGNLLVEYSEEATCKPVAVEFTVVPGNIYDSFISGSDYLETDVVQVDGGASGASGLADFGTTGYAPATHKVQGVVLTDTATALTNAPTTGDLTSTMKASVTTAATAATPTAASVTNPVTVSGDFSATMKTSIGTAVRTQIDSTDIDSPVSGSLGYLADTYLDAAISSRLAPAGTLATVTNLTNAPTSGDLTATMKASVTTACEDASGLTVAAVSGAVGSVTDKTGFKLASDGLDSVAAPTDITDDTEARANFVGMIRAIFNRFYNRVTQSSTEQIVRNDSDTSVSTMSVSVAGGVEEKGKSS